MKKQRKDYDFNAKDLMSALNETLDYARGKVTLRSTHHSLPPKATPITAKQIAGIRRRLNVSQTVFAKTLNVSPITAKSWESGRRTPCGAALRLLEIALQYPDVLTGTFSYPNAMAESGEQYLSQKV